MADLTDDGKRRLDLESLPPNKRYLKMNVKIEPAPAHPAPVAVPATVTTTTTTTNAATAPVSSSQPPPLPAGTSSTSAPASAPATASPAVASASHPSEAHHYSRTPRPAPHAASIPPATPAAGTTPRTPSTPSASSAPPTSRRRPASPPPLPADYPPLPEIELADDEPDDPLVAVQKKALWVQMQEYKRRWIYTSSQRDAARQQAEAASSASTAVTGILDDVHVTLDALADNAAAALPDDPNPAADPVVHAVLQTLHAHPHGDQTDLAHLSAALDTKKRHIERQLARLAAPASASAGLDPQCRADVVEAARLMRALARRNEAHHAQVAQLEAQIAELEGRIEVATRHVDRYRVGLAKSAGAPSTNGGIGAGGEAAPVGGTAAAGAAGGDAAAGGSVKTTDSGGRGAPTAVATAVAEERVRAQAQLAARDAQITQLAAEKAALTAELDALKTQFSVRVHQTIESSEVCMRLKADVEREHQTAVLLEAKLATVVSERTALEAQRRQFVAQTQAAQGSQAAALQAAVAQMDAENTRLRTHRDALQQSLDTLTAREAKHRADGARLKQELALTQAHLNSVTQRNTRLAMALAHNEGWSGIVAAFDIDGADAATLKAQIDRYEQHRCGDSAARHPSDATTEAAVTTEAAATTEAAGTSDQSADVVADLTAKLDFQTRTGSRLLSEVSEMSTTMQSMATQTSKLSAQLAERDERLHRLALDKAKLHQRNGVLTKQAGVATQLAAASKLAGERAAEHARVHMERERVLDEQARALRLQLDETAMLLDAARKRCAEGAAVRGEMDERVRVATARAEDAVAQLTARSAALEATAQALRDAQADLSAARAQLEQRERLGDGGAAAKQVEELRFLLLCSSCRKRFKSHCLARCMHVFCKDCIDDMYTSRQRKCPSCGLGFGQQDIRQVYL